MTVVPADQAVRERLRHELDTTFFVEAGAGTGKTTEIVARIVELAAAGWIESPRGLVAITFTVAAAAELRSRIREGLEEAGRDPTRTETQRANCQRVARGIDEAAIDTIHAFAGSLLRTFPLEAGLPPNFEGLDEIEQDIEFDDRFREWYEQVSGDRVGAETIRKALLLGMTTDQIRAAAKGLHDHYDLLHAPPNWTPEDAVVAPMAAAHDAAGHLARCEELLRRMPRESITKMVAGQHFARERLGGAATDDQAVAALRAVEHVPSGEGNMSEWDDAYGKGAGETLRQAKQALGKIKRESHVALQELRRAVFVELLELLAAEVLGWSADRKRRGIATFQDLLTWSRDLLRSNAEVRRLAQGRWSRIFVDEFQDTDPLQAELAFYLAAEPAGRFDGHWRHFSLVPGKLFLVGDPKQSIYRFRRADIALYHLIQEVIPESPLSQNFRSVPHIVDWVNLHYRDVMKLQPGVQPRYQPLAAEPDDTGEGVWSFGGAVTGPQAKVWGAEAKAVARCARDVVADEWRVSDGKGTRRSSRRARYGDVCVLIPSRTNLKRLERAFDDERVPYRLESGELIVATQEIRDLVSCLRAIDDPSDQVALVATLRSAIYGCSDDELLEWVEAGERFRYEWIAASAPRGRVRESLEDLKRRHIARHETSVPALIERILRERLLVPAAFGQRRPREIWRRYRYLVDRARAFGDTGRTSLRSFVDWIEGIEKEQVRGVSPAVAETDEDAVRVMTVHGAKGLEFPIVILTGWGSKRAASAGTVIPDRENDRLEVGLRIGDDWDWATAGYEEARKREKELGTAEGLRVSYVASTRARDHLVISLFRKEGGDPQGADFARNLARFELAAQLQLDRPRTRTADAAPPATPRTPEQSLEAEREWVERRRGAIVALGAMRVQTATSLAHDDEPGAWAAVTRLAGDDEPDETAAVKRDDGARFRRGRGATALGRAVHGVLETIELETLDGLDLLAKAEAEAEGIGHRTAEVAKLVRNVWSSEPVQAAIGSGRYWREVPAGASLGATRVEGFIDLLYERDGRLFVVDYKTDDVSLAEIDDRAHAYRLQGGAYAFLVGEATRSPVAAVEFVFARTGAIRRLDDVPALVDEVRARLRDREGGPLVAEEGAAG